MTWNYGILMFQDSRQEHAKQNHKNSSIIKHYQKKNQQEKTE